MVGFVVAFYAGLQNACCREVVRSKLVNLLVTVDVAL
jgi:hypothetical protein